MYQIHQKLILNLDGIPPGAASVTLAVTPPPGGTVNLGQWPPKIDHGRSSARFVPDAAGTWSYLWTATDPGGLTVGTASGTIEVVLPDPVPMHATVIQADG